MSSRWNQVDGDSIKLLNDERDSARESRFLNKYGFTKVLENWRQFMSEGAELSTGALGHGGTLKYPDYPYLKLEFPMSVMDGSTLAATETIPTLI